MKCMYYPPLKLEAPDFFSNVQFSPPGRPVYKSSVECMVYFSEKLETRDFFNVQFIPRGVHVIDCPSAGLFVLSNGMVFISA